MDEVLISCLPIMVIAAVWIFIIFRMKKTFKNAKEIASKQDEMIDVLKEISNELKVLNKNNATK